MYKMDLKIRRELVMKFQVDIIGNFNEEGQILSITDIIQSLAKINKPEFLEKNKLIINDVFVFFKETGVLHQMTYIKEGGVKSVQFQLTKYGKKFIDIFVRPIEGDESMIDENDDMFKEIKDAYTKLGFDENGKKTIQIYLLKKDKKI